MIDLTLIYVTLEQLHRYEKQRIEHRGGTHDIADYDGRGNFNTGRCTKLHDEEQVAVGAVTIERTTSDMSTLRF